MCVSVMWEGRDLHKLNEVEKEMGKGNYKYYFYAVTFDQVFDEV